jgi:hypothetical protein
MHDAQSALDVVAECQHCQFVRCAQDPPRLEWREAASAALSGLHLRWIRWLCSETRRQDNSFANDENKKAGASEAPASAVSDLFSRPTGETIADYFWMLA